MYKQCLSMFKLRASRASGAIPNHDLDHPQPQAPAGSDTAACRHLLAPASPRTRQLCGAVLLSLLCLLAPRVQADQVIITEKQGAASGGGYFPLDAAFDEPPDWDEVNRIPVGGGGTPVSTYPNRYGFIDFGSDWQRVRITSTWTLYRPKAVRDHTPYDKLWWDHDKDTNNRHYRV
jgi:hypothetical protein